jgi:hypothetical protein
MITLDLSHMRQAIGVVVLVVRFAVFGNHGRIVTGSGAVRCMRGWTPRARIAIKRRKARSVTFEARKTDDRA